MSVDGERMSGRIRRFVRQEVDRQLALSLFSPIAVLTLWELLSQGGVLDPLFFPPPTEILALAASMIADGSLVHHTRISLSRIVPGFVIGSVTGVVLGLLMGWSRKMYAVGDPIISAIFPVPRIVLLPIIFLIFGLTETARVAVLALAVFLFVVINTMEGVHDIDQGYIDAARDNGADGYTMIREILFPAALPNIFSGLSLGMGVGFILIVVVEMIASESGLGFLIWDSWELFDVMPMYVAILTINVLGAVFIYGIEWVGRYFTWWNIEN